MFGIARPSGHAACLGGCNAGESIPPGWALDGQGVATTDPVEAIDGIIMPMAQHKGYAITVIMDMLSGVLTSAFGTEVHGAYQSRHRSGAGQLMMALNIGAMQPLDEFGAHMERDIAALKSAPLAAGCDEISVSERRRLARSAGVDRTVLTIPSRRASAPARRCSARTIACAVLAGGAEVLRGARRGIAH